MATDDDTEAGGDGPTLQLEWSAYLRRSAAGIELVVEGTGTAPTSGWTAELVREEPQGANPSDLLLGFVEHRPTGPVLDVLTPITVSYTEPVESEDQLDTVTIVGIATLRIRPL
jgi:hypothetical protein